MFLESIVGSCIEMCILFEIVKRLISYINSLFSGDAASYRLGI